MSNAGISGMTGKPAKSYRQEKQSDKRTNLKLKDCMCIMKISEELKKIKSGLKMEA